MSFSFVGVSGDGAAVVVNSDELPQPPHSTAPHNFPTQQLDTMSTIVPFSSFLNPLASFSSSFGGFSTITTAPGFSTFSNPSWNPYAPMADPPPLEDTTKKRYFEPTTSLATAAARKKRKQNFFEEEEATCAKCHYRRKCMKCINCFARFCEQRCLPRYLEDPAAQEEVKLTNTWLCPCCKGIEPPGKYKGSDISRKDVEESKEKDEDDDDAKPSASSSSSSSNATQQIVPQQSPIQAHVTPTHSQSNSYFLDHQSQNPFSQFQQQNQLQMQQQLQLQQQQLKLQQLQQQQQQQYQLHQLQQQQQQLLQQQFPSQFSSSPAQLQVPSQRSPNPQQAQMYAFPIQSPNTTPQNKGLPPGGLGGEPGSEIGPDSPTGQTKEKKPKVNGVAMNGGAIAIPGEGNPDEYPKETEDFCSVCGDIYSYDDNNEIIYCDGCNVAVHQACYGVSKIPAGEWLCDRCKSKVLPECFLCSQKGGAMKEIVDLPGRWVHVTCVATLYELRPLDYSHKIGPPGIVDKIDKRRYHLKCAVCKEKNTKNVTGPLIQCKSKRCTQAFHPICCKKKLIYCKDLGIFVTYCQKHANEAPQTS